MYSDTHVAWLTLKFWFVIFLGPKALYIQPAQVLFFARESGSSMRLGLSTRATLPQSIRIVN